MASHLRKIVLILLFQTPMGSMSSYAESIKERIAHFQPSQVATAPVDPTQLHFRGVMDPSKNTYHLFGVDGKGIEAHVRFAIYRGEDVAVKFFKIEGSNKWMDQTLATAKIKQSYFLLDVVHELDLAPKPYAYAVGEEVKALAQSAGLTKQEYYGAIIMERIRPKVHPKSNLIGVASHAVEDSELEKKLKKAHALINDSGIEIHDLDYMIDHEGQFRFIDLDQWTIRNQAGAWNSGQLRKTSFEDDCQNALVPFLKKVFNR